MATVVLPACPVAQPSDHAAPVRQSRGGRQLAVVLLVGFLALGAAARVRQFSALPSFWYDESYLVVNIADKGYAELWGPLRCDQAAPPLFLWLLRWLYVNVGGSEWALRLPALLASLAALPLLVPLARRSAGTPGALWAVGFCAFSSHAISHGFEVKPYALDLLMSTALLLLASGLLLAAPGSSGRRLYFLALLAAASLGPWVSYPSVFILGGASLALGLQAWTRRDARSWLAWGSLNGVLLLSAGAVFLICARHQRTTSLEDWWQHAFIDWSAGPGVLVWLANYFVKIGNYGTTGLGVPLVLLSAVGWLSLWRQSRPLVALLAGPLVIVLIPNTLRLYPLDDRLLFFAVPCLWLSAAAGVTAIANRLSGWRAGIAIVALSALLVPGVARTAKALVVVKPKAAFREAFEYVAQVQSGDDVWWVSHPEVAEAYLGKKRRLFGMNDAPAVVAEAACGKRLWLVVCLPETGPPLPLALVRRLEDAGYQIQRAKDSHTVAVYCAEPLARRGSSPRRVKS